MPRWLYYLLILAVIAPIISLVGGPHQETAIFICSTLSLIPLAALIGRATEDLEHYVGPIVGGLLNATFGNAPELIIGIFALRQGLISVVKASITGSVISNALLVLGGALALGGWRWGKQYFSNRDAGQYSAMMVMAVAGLLIPLIASISITDKGRMQSISIGIAAIMLVIYIMYLALNIFHVRAARRNPTQRRSGKIAPPPREEEEPEEEEVEEARDQAIAGGLGPRSQEAERAEPGPPLWLAATMLLVATLGTAWNSELLVGAIEPVAKELGWSTTFIGLVIIPIIGNAAEHSSALLVAFKDRVDLSMAIAAGSSIQVATLVAPLLVLISLFLPQHLDLVFQPSNCSC
ncbi:calcium/proton exchanger [Ktedonosporobacter rubrisoli]|uniref:Ca(2+)/H(+) antiporter n=1 Tax=Ktedonosporobacter rubrisoli TaxID=2509675 RepID=A0A4P6JVK4_KTERU|nr:calcium/proton exchanger [Ktedonosporobacter rubrisoli]QBD79370.1 calcium/proton exchanger [Ktedonosporobacter rubrisoli]